MTVKRNTSDDDAHDSAVALLAAAGELDVDPALIRTISDQHRIDFTAPDAVYDEAFPP